MGHDGEILIKSQHWRQWKNRAEAVTSQKVWNLIAFLLTVVKRQEDWNWIAIKKAIKFWEAASECSVKQPSRRTISSSFYHRLRLWFHLVFGKQDFFSSGRAQACRTKWIHLSDSRCVFRNWRIILIRGNYLRGQNRNEAVHPVKDKTPECCLHIRHNKQECKDKMKL